MTRARIATNTTTRSALSSSHVHGCLRLDPDMNKNDISNPTIAPHVSSQLFPRCSPSWESRQARMKRSKRGGCADGPFTQPPTTCHLVRVHDAHIAPTAPTRAVSVSLDMCQRLGVFCHLISSRRTLKHERSCWHPIEGFEASRPYCRHFLVMHDSVRGAARQDRIHMVFPVEPTDLCFCLHNPRRSEGGCESMRCEHQLRRKLLQP